MGRAEPTASLSDDAIDSSSPADVSDGRPLPVPWALLVRAAPVAAFLPPALAAGAQARAQGSEAVKIRAELSLEDTLGFLARVGRLGAPPSSSSSLSSSSGRATLFFAARFRDLSGAAVEFVRSEDESGGSVSQKTRECDEADG